jgi:hypothetical protein
MLDRAEIVRSTEEYGGPWSLNHTGRLLGLVENLAGTEPYDRRWKPSLPLSKLRLSAISGLANLRTSKIMGGSKKIL